jgi:hypothetical protein
VQGVLAAVVRADRHVGQVTVLVVVQDHHRFGGVAPGPRIGAPDPVAELDILDGLAAAVGHRHPGTGVEAVPARRAAVLVDPAGGRFVGRSHIRRGLRVGPAARLGRAVVGGAPAPIRGR